MKKIYALLMASMLLITHFTVLAEHDDAAPLKNSTHLDYQFVYSEDEDNESYHLKLDIYPHDESTIFLYAQKYGNDITWAYDELHFTEIFVNDDFPEIDHIQNAPFSDSELRLFYKIDETIYSLDINFDDKSLDNHQKLDKEIYPNIYRAFIYHATDQGTRDYYGRNIDDAALADEFLDIFEIVEGKYVTYKHEPESRNVFNDASMYFYGYQYNANWYEDENIHLSIYHPFNKEVKIYKLQLDTGETTYHLPIIDYNDILKETDLNIITMAINSESPHPQAGSIKITGLDYEGKIIDEHTLNFHALPFAPQVFKGGEGYLGGKLPKVNGVFATNYIVEFPDGTVKNYTSKNGDFEIYFDTPEISDDILAQNAYVLIKHPETGVYIRSAINFFGIHDIDYNDYLTSIIEDVEELDLDGFTDESVEALSDATKEASSLVNTKLRTTAVNTSIQTLYNATIDIQEHLLKLTLKEEVIPESTPTEPEEELETETPKEETPEVTPDDSENEVKKDQVNEENLDDLPGTGSPSYILTLSLLLLTFSVMLYFAEKKYYN